VVKKKNQKRNRSIDGSKEARMMFKQKFVVIMESKKKCSTEDIGYALRDVFTEDRFSVKEIKLKR